MLIANPPIFHRIMNLFKFQFLEFPDYFLIILNVYTTYGVSLFTVNYLVDNFFLNVDVSISKFEQVVSQILKCL